MTLSPFEIKVWNIKCFVLCACTLHDEYVCPCSRSNQSQQFSQRRKPLIRSYTEYGLSPLRLFDCHLFIFGSFAIWTVVGPETDRSISLLLSVRFFFELL